MKYPSLEVSGIDWATWPSFGQGAGLDDLQSSLGNQILWVCVSHVRIHSWDYDYDYQILKKNWAFYDLF